MDADLHQPGKLQGRRGLVCDRQHQRWPEGRGLRPAGAVFRNGCGKDDGQFCGIEEAGAGAQVLRPLRAGPGGGVPWHGADDGPVQHRPKHGVLHHEFVRLVRHDGNYAP